ncbi:MAG: symporter small accessory protein [Candidatus Caldatribacteriaceae bacterium]
MFGLHDPWIILAYVLCVGSTLLCVFYGVSNWNKGGIEVKKEKVLQWEKTEEILEE